MTLLERIKRRVGVMDHRPPLGIGFGEARLLVHAVEAAKELRSSIVWRQEDAAVVVKFDAALRPLLEEVGDE